MYTALRKSGRGVAPSTVYRALRRLAEEGRIDGIQSATGERLYRRCATGSPHHHLVCRVCFGATEIEDVPGIGVMAARIVARNGYQASAYSIAFSGVCATCGIPARTDRPRPSEER